MDYCPLIPLIYPPPLYKTHQHRGPDPFPGSFHSVIDFLRIDWKSPTQRRLVLRGPRALFVEVIYGGDM